MKILEFYSKNILAYDLLNKFMFKNTSKLPKLQKIVLTFCLKKYEVKYLLTSLVALKMVSNVKICNIIKSKSSNISLKIKKGNPIGSKVVLRKTNMNLFLFKLINLCFLEEKNLVNINKNSFSFKIRDLLKFTDLEQNYKYFKNLPILSINIVTTSTKRDLLLFLMKSYKLK